MTFRDGIFTFIHKLSRKSKRKATQQARHQRRRALMVEGLEDRKLLAFTAGNLVVARVGDGASSLDAASQPIALLEYTPGGGSGTTVYVPSIGSGRLTVTGNNATAEGAITLSQNGQFLHVVGYDANAGTLNVAGTSTTVGSAVPRLVGRISSNETVDLTTSTTDFSGNSIRSAASVDGSRFWLTGPNQANSRLRTTTYGSSGAAPGVTTTGNLRVAQIFGDQLYVSANNAIMTTADPLPTSGSTLNTLTLNMGPASRDFFDFVFLDRDSTANGDGYDTLYIADPTNGVLKYFSTDGTNWTYRQAVSTVKGTGIEAIVNGSVADIYATNGILSGNTFVKFTDSTTYDASIVASSLTTVATAGANFAFRGVAQSPASSSTAPSITTQPAHSSITYGADTTFTAAASGSPTPSVQWQTFVGGNWVDIDSSTDGGVYSNFTTDTLTVTKPGVALSTRTYRAHYANSAGTADTNVATLTVSPLGITATGTASSRVYDASTAASTSVVLTGVLGGDDLAGSVTGTFANKNVANGKTVTLTGYSLNGAAAGNYFISSSNATTTADITALAITGVGTAADKVYDRTTTATVAVSLSGVISGDTVSGSATGAFDTKNIGTGKTVALTSYGLAGADAGNYTVTGNASTTANITAKALTATGTASSKIYNASTTAATAVSLAGVIGGDSVGGSVTGAFVDKHVGAGKTVNLTSYALAGADAGNYTVTGNATTTASISAKGIDILAVTPQDKVYDGGTLATFTVTLNGVIAGDEVTPIGSGYFASKTVGIDKEVYYDDTTLSGADGGNYSLNIFLAPPVQYADITAKALTATGAANHKIYDGNTTATTSVSLAGVIGGDVVSGSVTGVFSDKNIGTGKTVNLSGYLLSGVDAGNYSVSGNVTTTANITAKALTATGTASNKTYDGNTSATTAVSLDGVISGDVVNGSVSGVFADKHAATGKVVNLSGYSLSGADAGNYTVSGNTSTTANIATLSITVTAVAASKVYDGNTSSTSAPSIAPALASGDTGAFVQTYENALVGTGKTLTPSGTVNDGNSGNNYSYTFVVSANGSITASSPAPTLSTVLINDGAAFLNGNQRSQVVSLRVTFSGSVTVDPDAFTLTNLGLFTASTTLIPQDQIHYASGTATSFVITFGAGDVPLGAIHNGVVRRAGNDAVSAAANSLADGNYKLTIDPTKVHAVDGQSLEGNHTYGAAQAEKFFRMFGDSDGDGDVDGTDTVAFRRAQAIYNAALDWDGAGAVTVNSSDSTHFTANNSKKRRNIGS